MKTYRIEIKNGAGKFEKFLTWSGMNKSRAQGAMMAIDALSMMAIDAQYGGYSFRMVCNQTDEIIETAGVRERPNVSCETI